MVERAQAVEIKCLAKQHLQLSTGPVALGKFLDLTVGLLCKGT